MNGAYGIGLCFGSIASLVTSESNADDVYSIQCKIFRLLVSTPFVYSVRS